MTRDNGTTALIREGYDDGVKDQTPIFLDGSGHGWGVVQGSNLVRIRLLHTFSRFIVEKD